MGGDSFEIEDGANISIDDFREPLITGYKYTMKINASSSFLVEFLANKNKYLKFYDITSGSYNYIWIDQLKTNLVDNAIELEGHECIDVTTLESGFILQENGDYILQENGDKILLEAS